MLHKTLCGIGIPQNLALYYGRSKSHYLVICQVGSTGFKLKLVLQNYLN